MNNKDLMLKKDGARIFTCNKPKPLWPYGLTAVVIAKDRFDAANMMSFAMSRERLPGVVPDDMEEIEHRHGIIKLMNMGDG